MLDLEELKKIIRSLLRQSKLSEAIDRCLEWAEEENIGTIQDSLILIKSRHATVEDQRKLSLITKKEAHDELLSISTDLLHLLNSDEPPLDLSKSKILFLASNPSNTAKLQLEKEFAVISRLLQDSKYPYVLVSEWGVTTDAIQKAILFHKPNIIHFSGHGVRGQDNQEGGFRNLALNDDDNNGILLQHSDGTSKPISQIALEDLFSIFTKRFLIKAVVLNACYSENQAEGISKYVDTVIGMRRSIEDTSAIEFSKGFYLGLAMENDIDFAFELGKSKIFLEGLKDQEIPIVFGR